MTVLKSVTAAVCLAALALAAPVGAQQAYPQKPVRLIAPFAPGGGTDILARLFGQKMTEALGQQIIVDNRPGAGGTIGTDIAAKAPPDGYTLILVSASHVINPGLYRKLPFDAINDFAPITQLATSPGILVVHPGLPVKSVRDLIALAKAKPGQINYASAGSGTPPHLAGELFKVMAGIDMVHVPYKGNAQALTALLTGEISMAGTALPSAMPYIPNGRLRPIAVTSVRRSPAVPQVPTLAQAGARGYEYASEFGLLLPARVPVEVVNKLHAEIARILKTPEMAERLGSQGYEVAGAGPEEYAAAIRRDLAKWSKVIRAANIRAE